MSTLFARSGTTTNQTVSYVVALHSVHWFPAGRPPRHVRGGEAQRTPALAASAAAQRRTLGGPTRPRGRASRGLLGVVRRPPPRPASRCLPRHAAPALADRHCRPPSRRGLQGVPRGLPPSSAGSPFARGCYRVGGTRRGGGSCRRAPPPGRAPPAVAAAVSGVCPFMCCWPLACPPAAPYPPAGLIRKRRHAAGVCSSPLLHSTREPPAAEVLTFRLPCVPPCAPPPPPHPYHVFFGWVER